MTNKSLSSKFNSIFAIIVIPALIVLCYIFYFTILGDGSNFVNNDPDNHPLPGNYFGIIYKGGLVVPVLISFLLMVITFSIERFITIERATGQKSISEFVIKVKDHLSKNNIDLAIEECDLQKGSVGNVSKAALLRYKEIEKDSAMTRDEKSTALQKELDESTTLELPMLEKNLTIIATLASVATLVGLLGTVIGMIKAFAALASAGSPDAIALANGISEALINTALGIASSALAIVSYNYFTSRIDTLTYGIDEIGFSLMTMHAKESGKTV